MLVIKYLTINQLDDLCIILDKMKHLLIGHYVRDDVQSFNVVLYQDSSPMNFTLTIINLVLWTKHKNAYCIFQLHF